MYVKVDVCVTETLKLLGYTYSIWPERNVFKNKLIFLINNNYFFKMLSAVKEKRQIDKRLLKFGE